MKFKIGLGIFIVIAAIVGAKLFIDFKNDRILADTLTAKIQTDTLALGKISNSAKAINNEINSLNAEIVKTQDELQASGRIIPDQVDPNEVIKIIFVEGSGDHITLVPLSTTPWTPLNISREDKTRVFRMTFSISGKENNIADFIQWLQDSPFPSLVIENFKMAKTLDPAGETIVAANINLALFSK
jgi:hypothetical protein